MWDAKIKAGVLREFFGLPAVLTDEIVCVINDQGIQYRIVDPAHVGLVTANLSLKAFSEWTFTDTAPLKILIDYERFKQIWKYLKPTDIIRFIYTDSDSKCLLRIEFLGMYRKFSIDKSVMEGICEPKIPNINFPNKISIKKSVFLRIVDAISNLHDLDVEPSFILECRKDSIEISSYSKIGMGFAEEMGLELTPSNVEGYQYSKDSKSMYQCCYINPMLRAIKTPVIVFWQSTNYPIRIDFDLTSGQDIIGSGSFILAPQIE